MIKAQNFISALWQEHQKREVVMVAVDSKTFNALLSHPALADCADSSGSIIWRYITIYEDKNLPKDSMLKLYRDPYKYKL